MKLLIFLLLSTVGYAQNVDIFDKDHKLIKRVDEKKLDKTIKELKGEARYTARWIDYKAVECRIKEIKPEII